MVTIINKSKEDLYEVKKLIYKVEIMKGGYESMVWLNDEEGREYACYLEDVKGLEKGHHISEELKKRCLNVNELVGTERW